MHVDGDLAPIGRPDRGLGLAHVAQDDPLATAIDEERALLVAMAEVEAANLSEDEREAVEKLRDQVEDYDPDELSRAVEHMMSAKAKKGRKLKWPELKPRRRRRRKTASSSKKKA